MTKLPIVPGLRGDHKGTCIVCFTPTDTALAFQGEAEWCLAGLEVLGLPSGQAYATFREYWNERHPANPLLSDQVPDGIIQMPVRVCRDCVRGCGPSFPDPVLVLPGGALPTISPLP